MTEYTNGSADNSLPAAPEPEGPLTAKVIANRYIDALHDFGLESVEIRSDFKKLGLETIISETRKQAVEPWDFTDAELAREIMARLDKWELDNGTRTA